MLYGLTYYLPELVMLVLDRLLAIYEERLSKPESRLRSRSTERPGLVLDNFRPTSRQLTMPREAMVRRMTPHFDKNFAAFQRFKNLEYSL